MGEGKFYGGGELIDIALSNSPGSEAGKQKITVDNPDVLEGEILPLYLVGALDPIPDVVFYDEDTGIWTDKDGNDLNLADFDYDAETYTYEVTASAGDTVTVICVTPQSGAAPGYFKLTAIGSLLI